MKKKLSAIVFVIALCLLFVTPAMAAPSAPDGGTGWFLDEETNDYYYYEDYEMVTGGFKTIGGELYHFEEDGRLSIGTFWEDEQDWFAENSGRVVTGVTGWYQYNGGWYWFFDNYSPAYCTKVDIQGNTYAFGEDSRMVTGAAEFWQWDDELQDSVYCTVFANEYGIVDETPGWKLFNGKWYWVKSDGSAAWGEFVKISTNTYFFDWDGTMKTGTFWGGYYDEELDQWIDIFCMADDSGAIVTTPGWKLVDGKWYWIKEDGSVARDEFIEASGKKYYFDWDGVMVTGFFYTEYWDEDAEAWMIDTFYIADASGAVATTQGWYKYDGWWYYLKSDGYVAQDEFVDIAGKTYYFEWWGTMVTGHFTVEDADYIADDSGAVMVNPGWYTYAGNKYFVKEDGELARDEALDIGGETYLFDYDGWMLTGVQWYWNEEDEEWDYYFASSTGAVIKNGWINDIVWYYADADGVLASNEWKMIGGREYWFHQGGEMAVGGAQTDRGYFLFDESGRLIKELGSQKGWELADGIWLYYEEPGQPYTGWVGSYYISENMMAFNTIVPVDMDNDKWCYVGADGTIQTGWVNIDDWWAYAEADGTVVQNGWKLIGGTWYYFMDGMMLSDGIYVVNDNGIERTCEFRANGAWVGYVTTGWYRVADGTWHYTYEDGTLPNGPTVISGITYYFSWGSMLQNECAYGYEYDMEEDVWVTAAGTKDNGSGWRTNGKHWYYLEKGEFIYGLKKIGGAEYYFEPQMQTGYRYVYDTNEYAFFGESGARQSLSTGWYYTVEYDSPVWYYMVNGKPIESGFQKIGGTTYYFNQYGQMLNDFFYSSNGLYVFDNNGQIVRNQWIYKQSEWMSGWFYTDASGRAYVGQHTINGITYYFDWYGRWIK